MKENKYVQEIVSVFNNHNNDRYKCHELLQKILKKAAADSLFLYDVIRHNLNSPEFIEKKRHYSTLALPVIATPDFNIVINIFPPLPDRTTNISFQSIHHHGNLLLTTAALFGPGYESIVFKKNYTIDKESYLTKMEREKTYQFKQGVVEFIDKFQPHIVFYPESISATLALWSNDQKTGMEAFKKFTLLQKFKKPIKQLLKATGLSKSLQLNEVSFFDFYPEKEKLYAMKDRLEYSFIGSNENFIQNIFHFIQQTGFNDNLFLSELKEKKFINLFTKQMIDKVLKGEQIKDEFIPQHLNVPKVNLLKDDILKATR